MSSKIATHYIYGAIHYNSIAILSKQLIYNSYNNYTHDAMLTSLIVIHLLKFNM
jgi:hypothetical protein